MNILVINGPNLNLLGKREPNIYGSETLNDIKIWVDNLDFVKAHTINWYQSNHEGEIIDKLHEAINDNTEGIIINPGAFTHYSYAIRDAIVSIGIPVAEVHLSNINSREKFRQKSVIKDVCITQISGLGKKGYADAINALIKLI